MHLCKKLGSEISTAASHSERLAESSFCHDCERAMSKAALKRDPHEEGPAFRFAHSQSRGPWDGSEGDDTS